MKAFIQGIPKGFWSDDWRHNFVNALPMGVFAIANYCKRQGHDVRVSNASVYGDRQTALEVMLRRIRDFGAEVVGIPLHWHLSGYDVLRTAQRIKETLPQVHVVLGGVTASAYPVEILEYSPFVDSVIVGDGEIPFCSLLDVLKFSPKDPDFSSVPNLVWRDADAIIKNGIGYVARAEELSDLDFSPQGSLLTMREYANGLRLEDAVNGIPFNLYGQDIGRRAFFMNIGRGCTYNCIYCGGSRVAHQRLAGRDGITVRKVTSVVADFQRCFTAGFRRFHICFDPEFPQKEQYFEELFESIRSSIGSECQLIFEAYNLPSRTFLESAGMTFAWVGIVISPCFFDLGIRRACKGYSFSDEAMEEKVKEIFSIQRCQPFIYYAVTPMEDWSDENLFKRIETICRLRSRTGVELTVLPIFAEPASPWVLFPEVFGKRKFSFDFRGFLQEWQRPLSGWNDHLTGIRGTARIMERFQGALLTAG
jgi:hypothetical protein